MRDLRQAASGVVSRDSLQPEAHEYVGLSSNDILRVPSGAHAVHDAHAASRNEQTTDVRLDLVPGILALRTLR